MEGPGRQLCFLCTSRYVAITVIPTLGSLDSLNCGERNSNYFFHYLCYISSRLPHTQTFFKSDCHFFFLNESCFTPWPPPKTHAQTHTKAFFFSFFPFRSCEYEAEERWQPVHPGCHLGKVWSNDGMELAFPSLCLFHSLTAREHANWKENIDQA